jgi:hypothetical protein
MFPVLGEVTAVRDSIAITIRMCTEPGAAKDKWEWISLVCCLLALVPAFGGLLKGVGGLIVEAGKSSKKAVEIVEGILKFLNRMGVGDARSWFKELKILRHQTTVINSFHELIGRIKATCTFLSTKMGAALPESFKVTLRVFSEKLDELQKLGDRMIPEAFKEFHEQLSLIQKAVHDGSYIAPIRVGAKETRVMVPEGKILVQKVITGHIEHPPAPISHYLHDEKWPDLKAKGLDGKKPFEIEEIEAQGYLWPISTFSAKAPIKAHLARPGEGLYRLLDKIPTKVYGGNEIKPKYLHEFHQAGDCWSPKLPANGKEFRIELAVKHAWNSNGFYEKLIIPTRKQLEEKLKEIAKMHPTRPPIPIPDGWEGLRTWRGTVGGQLDIEAKVENGLKNSNTWLEGGGVQDFIDWSHPHNAPVKEYLLETLKTAPPKPTGWTDVQLPVHPLTEKPVVWTLPEAERSAKIQAEGYQLRGAATAGKQSNNASQKEH